MGVSACMEPLSSSFLSSFPFFSSFPSFSSSFFLLSSFFFYFLMLHNQRSGVWPPQDSMRLNHLISSCATLISSSVVQQCRGGGKCVSMSCQFEEEKVIPLEGVSG